MIHTVRLSHLRVRPAAFVAWAALSVPAAAFAQGDVHPTPSSAPPPSSSPVSPATVPTTPAPAPPTFPAPKLGGYIQARETAQHDIGLTALLNRSRFSIDGSLPTNFTYRLLVELEASAGAKAPATVSLREAIARWSWNGGALTAGQFKTPFSREYLLPVPVLETADFAAVVDSLAPKYDVGAMAEYAFGPFASVYAGVFNGEGQNATANRDSTVLGVARVVARPFAQLAVGASYARDGRDSLRWGVEGNVEEYGGVVRAEYITRHVKGRATSRDDRGWYVFGGYRVVPFVQLIGRQEDFQRPWYGVARRVRGTTLGANIDLAPNRVKLLVEATRKRTGAKQTRGDALIGQLQVRF